MVDLDFASLAKKNLASAGELAAELPGNPMSDLKGLSGAGLRVDVLLSRPCIPRPETCGCISRASRNGTRFVDRGDGVPVAVDVPRGVVFVLSARDFRELDLGVMLLLRNEDTGVVKSFLDEPTGVVVSGRAFRCDEGVFAGVFAPASRGVNGGFGVESRVFDGVAREGSRGFRVAAAPPLFLS